MPQRARRGSAGPLFADSENTAALSTGLNAAGLTFRRRGAHCCTAFSPYSRTDWTADPTTISMPRQPWWTVVFAATGPIRATELPADPTAIGLTPAHCAGLQTDAGTAMRCRCRCRVSARPGVGNCHLRSSFFKGSITRWRTPNYPFGPGAGTSRARSNNHRGNHPANFTLAYAAVFRTGLRLLFALQTNRDKQLRGLRHAALLNHSPSHSHRVTSPVMALAIPTLVQRY